jgi:hypothetical protein
MKVYIVVYRYWDDSEVIGVFTSADIAEKYIEQSILTCFGKKADISKYRDCYSVSIEDVIAE